jgi:hypothetical protein
MGCIMPMECGGRGTGGDGGGMPGGCMPGGKSIPGGGGGGNDIPAPGIEGGGIAGESANSW